MFRPIFLLAAACVLTIQMASAQPSPGETGGVLDPSLCDGPCDPYPGSEHDAGEGMAGSGGNGQPRAVVAPSGLPEIIVSGPISEFEAARDGLTDAGAQLLRYRDLPALGIRIAIYDFRWQLGIRRANVILDDVAPNTNVGRHHIYELSQARPRVYAASMIGDAAQGSCPVGRRAIGLIDGPVDPDHPALAGAQDARVLSVGYLGLTPDARPLNNTDAHWDSWTRFSNDWRFIPNPRTNSVKRSGPRSFIRRFSCAQVSA